MWCNLNHIQMDIEPAFFSYHNSGIRQIRLLYIPLFVHLLGNLSKMDCLLNDMEWFLPVFRMDSLYQIRYLLLLRQLPVHKDTLLRLHLRHLPTAFPPVNRYAVQLQHFSVLLRFPESDNSDSLAFPYVLCHILRIQRHPEVLQK